MCTAQMDLDTTVDGLAAQLQIVILDKLAAEKRAEALEELVNAQNRRIAELEAELDLTRQQRKTPPIRLAKTSLPPMMDIGHEEMHWTPAATFFSPIADNRNQSPNFFASPNGCNFRTPRVLLSPISRTGRRLNILPSPLARNDQNMEFHDEFDEKPKNDTAKKASQARSLFHEAIFRGVYMSPNLFASYDTPSSHSNSTPKSFRWSIEHQSFMNPAQIDETKAIEQSSSLFETADDQKIQQVVSDYFTSCHFPSPHISRTSRMTSRDFT